MENHHFQETVPLVSVYAPLDTLFIPSDKATRKHKIIRYQIAVGNTIHPTIYHYIDTQGMSPEESTNAVICTTPAAPDYLQVLLSKLQHLANAHNNPALENNVIEQTDTLVGVDNAKSCDFSLSIQKITEQSHFSIYEALYRSVHDERVVEDMKESI